MEQCNVELDPIEVPRTFDVDKRGEYIGMPRLKEYLVQLYYKLGIDFNKLSLKQR